MNEMEAMLDVTVMDVVNRGSSMSLSRQIDDNTFLVRSL